MNDPANTFLEGKDHNEVLVDLLTRVYVLEQRMKPDTRVNVPVAPVAPVAPIVPQIPVVFSRVEGDGEHSEILKEITHS